MRRWIPAAAVAVAVLGLGGCFGSGTVLRFAGHRHAVSLGVNSDISWGISSADIRREIARIRAAGIRWIRAPVDLSGVEYDAPGRLNQPYVRQIDVAMRAARAAKLNVLMVMDRTPYWASADPHRHRDGAGLHWNTYYRYRRPEDYARIAAAVVRRYSAMGIHAYEVWNEPNYRSSWPSGVDPAAYTRLLTAAYPAIKAADPRATVVMGGLSQVRVYQFLLGMYRAGALGSYDVANFHLYTDSAPSQCADGSDGRADAGSLCVLRALHSEMAGHGDRAPVWVTEFGWSTCNADACVSPAQQASYVAGAVRGFESPLFPWVQKAFVYELRDIAVPGALHGWPSHLGLLNHDLSAKPAYAALRALASPPGGHSSQVAGGP